MAKDGKLLEPGMNHAQSFLVASEVGPPTRVHQKRGSDRFGLAFVTVRLHCDIASRLSEFANGPAFAHLSARAPGMFEQKIIESRALDLKSSRLPSETTVAEHELEAFARVAQMELRPELF